MYPRQRCVELKLVALDPALQRIDLSEQDLERDFLLSWVAPVDVECGFDAGVKQKRDAGFLAEIGEG